MNTVEGTEARESAASVTSCRDEAQWLTASRAGKITSAPSGHLKTENRVVWHRHVEFLSHDYKPNNYCVLPEI